MTACVNKKHTRRVALAISASLVGALSLGAAAPVVAEAAGIETLALDENAIAKGEVSYKSGEPGDTFTYNGLPQGIVPSTVTPYNGKAESLELLPQSAKRVKGDFYYYYVMIDGDNDKDIEGVQYKNEKGRLVDLKGTYVTDGKGNYIAPDKAGTYAVVVGRWGGDANSWDYVEVADTFKIVGQTLDGATLFEGDDVADTTFAYDGTETGLTVDGWKSKLGVAIDGVKLEKGADKDYILDIYKKGGNSLLSGTTKLMPDTTYIVKITGENSYDKQSVEREFSFGKLDLDSAVILTNVAIKQAPYADSKPEWVIESINGVAYNDLDSDVVKLAISFVSSPSGSSTSTGERGDYTFTVTPGAKDDKVDPSDYVKGSATVKQTYASFKAAIAFGNDDLKQVDGSYHVGLSESAKQVFDLDEIKVTYDNGDKTLKDGYTVTVTDDEGNDGDLTKPGTYLVKVSVNTEDKDGNLIAGSAVAKVVVGYTVDLDANVFVSFDGKNVEGNSIEAGEYTGEDLSEKLSIKVKSGDKEFVEGTDYTVELLKKQTDGKWAPVDSIVDAGTYGIVIKGAAFKGDFKYTLTVERAKADEVTVDQWVGPVKSDGGSVVLDSPNAFIAYTGAEIKPTFTFWKDGEELDVPADAYTVAYKGEKGQKAVKDEGKYSVTFTNAEVSNFDVEISGAAFTVKAAQSFTDVKATDWYAGSVYQAKVNNYIKGVAGSALFAPDADINRADVAVIIARMAGIDDTFYNSNGRLTDEGRMYAEYAASMFGDVSADMYYAPAIGWAAKMDIAHGNAGSYRPGDSITREEYAALLSNYAASKGEDISVDADAVLAGANGADTVSPWMRDAVAWAKSKGIMGNNGASLDGQGNITRAQTAAMSVNYQPLPLKIAE